MSAVFAYTLPDDPWKVDPAFVQMAPYVAYSETGRITTAGHQAPAFTMNQRLQGARVLTHAITGTFDDLLQRHYVDLDHGAPAIVERPVFTGQFAKTSLPVNAETVLKGGPACLLRFSGPENGMHQHPGGDLVLGFPTPGTYTLALEPFPYQAFTRTLEITA